MTYSIHNTVSDYDPMKKTSTILVLITAASLLVTLALAIYSLSTYQELTEKNKQISVLSEKIVEKEQALVNQQKPSLVTALGVSVDPRNDTLYPHPHFTFEGYVFNTGNRTAYNSRLEISAFFRKDGFSAFNLTIPLGNLEKYQIVQVDKIMATSDWIGNYTIVPLCEDKP